MIVFPNCKINLGLHVTRKREDGYHDLETIFFPLHIHDILEFVPAASFSFQSSGLHVKGNTDQNLCVKAYHLLKKECPALPEVSMHLHKVIPMGAGLGGGSADGSFALTSLNEYFHLGLDAGKLKALSLRLGSDCPFFILNQPCFATGRGEILEPLSLDLSGYFIILVYPGIAVNTAEAFEGISPQKPAHSLQEKITGPLEKWKEWMVNDFEQPVFRRFPEIAKIKQDLYNAGAFYAAMTGSGSSCFGIFRNPPELHFPGSYRVFRVQAK